jgi:hypothetical protein
MRRVGLVVLVAALAGCGTRPLATPDPLAVEAPRGKVQTSDAKLGLSWELPANWRRAYRKPPGLFRVLSGGAEVSGWAWFRTESMPKDVAAAELRKDALVEQIRKRDPAFVVSSVTTREVAGLPAIEVEGTQRLLGRPVRTRSVHIFKAPVEYVIEALAPPGAFAKTAEGVLEPVLASLKFADAPDA